MAQRSEPVPSSKRASATLVGDSPSNAHVRHLVDEGVGDARLVAKIERAWERARLQQRKDWLPRVPARRTWPAPALPELNAQIAGMLSGREEVAPPDVDERIRRLELQAAALMRTKARASLEPLVKEAEDAARLARALLAK